MICKYGANNEHTNICLPVQPRRLGPHTISYCNFTVRTSSLWIAGYDPYDNHTWIWDNANHDPVADSHWGSSEPNHIDDSYTYCIESYPESHDFKWNDARCTHNRGYICEFKL